LLNEPDLDKKVKEAAQEQDTTGSTVNNQMTSTEVAENSAVREYNLHQIIGVILGSPEFQRR